MKKIINYKEINKNTVKDYNDSHKTELIEITKCNKKYDIIFKETDDKFLNIRKAYEIKYIELNKQMFTIQKIHDEFYAELVKLSNDITNLNVKIKLYKLGKCPECETDLTKGDHVHKAIDYNKQYELFKKSEKILKTKFNNEIIKKENALKLIEDHKNDLRIINEQEGIIKLKNTEAHNNEKNEIHNKIVLAHQSKTKINMELIQVYKNQLVVVKSEIKDKYQLKYNDINKKLDFDKIKLSDLIDTKFKEKIENTKHELKIAEDIKQAKSLKYINNYNKYINDTEKLSEKTNRLLTIQSDYKNKSIQLETILQNKSTKSVISEMEKTSISLTKDYEETIDKCDSANKILENYKIIDKLVGDTGLKRDFMQRFIPMLNQNIYDVYNKLNFKYSFYFDNDFNPVIMDNNESIGIDTLSAGEKKEIDIMAVLAFIPLIKMRNPYTNVLFLDEIFYSLDKKNTALVTKLLKEFSIKYNMTIFVISHMDVPTEYFNKIYEPVYDGTYSDIKQLK